MIGILLTLRDHHSMQLLPQLPACKLCVCRDHASLHPTIPSVWCILGGHVNSVVLRGHTAQGHLSPQSAGTDTSREPVWTWWQRAPAGDPSRCWLTTVPAHQSTGLQERPTCLCTDIGFNKSDKTSNPTLRSMGTRDVQIPDMYSFNFILNPGFLKWHGTDT